MIKIFFLCCFLFLNTYANWKTKRENLDNFYQVGDFRIFYTLKGVHALKDKRDVNNNRIPDIVENVGRQLDTADRMFKEVLKLKSPITQEKYRIKNTRFFDVHFLKMKGKGSAGDASIFYDYKILKNRFNALSIAISNEITYSSLTPAHELFHAYQYGYTMFKNRWYLEGTARWSEKVFQLGTGKQKRLPSTVQEIHKLLNRTYDAKYFWNRLVRLTTKESKKFTLPKKLSEASYVGQNKKVVKDNEVYGRDFIRLFFQTMHQYDQIASQKWGYDHLSWKESQQKAFKNNWYILLSIKQTILDLNPKYNEELENFLKALDNYLKQWKKLQSVPDVSSQLQSLGIFYKNEYRDDTEHVYSRNPWDIKWFDNRLYVGAGNASNSAPSPNAGPVSVLSYDDSRKEVIEEFIVQDEVVDLFKVINNKLFIPGTDATQSHKWGNFYVKDGQWKKYRTIPKALHVFDMAYYNNQLFAAISTPKGAAVAISDDMGKQWKIQQLGKYQRAFALLEINKTLYVMKQIWHDKKIQDMASKTNEDYFFIAEYDKGVFIPRKDIRKEDIFPYKQLVNKRTVRISKHEKFQEGVAYLGAYYYDNPFAFFLSKDLNIEAKKTQKLEVSALLQPRDLVVDNKRLYLLASKRNYKEFESIVYTYDSEHKTVHPLFRLTTKAMIRSFDVEDNAFYFGLGSDVKSKKRWKQKELHPDTGKILKLEYKGK